MRLWKAKRNLSWHRDLPNTALIWSSVIKEASVGGLAWSSLFVPNSVTASLLLCFSLHSTLASQYGLLNSSFLWYPRHSFFVRFIPTDLSLSRLTRCISKTTLWSCCHHGLVNSTCRIQLHFSIPWWPCPTAHVYSFEFYRVSGHLYKCSGREGRMRPCQVLHALPWAIQLQWTNSYCQRADITKIHQKNWRVLSGAHNRDTYLRLGWNRSPTVPYGHWTYFHCWRSYICQSGWYRAIT